MKQFYCTLLSDCELLSILTVIKAILESTKRLYLVRIPFVYNIDMNQTQTEEDTMGMDQIPARANEARFTPIPIEGVRNRDGGISWWD